MAARRNSAMPISCKSSSTDPKSSKSDNPPDKGNNSGTGKKSAKSSSTVVKSRYLQSAEKASLSKSKSLTKESTVAPLRPSSPRASDGRPKSGTPTRRTVTPSDLATSIMSRETRPALMQSTFSDGHCVPPDFDISVIKDKTVIANMAKPERNPEDEKRIIDMQTFLLAYLTAKMENNTAKLKAETEAQILELMEEERRLSEEVKNKKRQWLLAEKNRMVNELLDVQIASLASVAGATKEFTEDYKCFATAVDATRHELPVKNFCIGEDGREFLDKAEAYLKESEKLLLECTDGDHADNSTSLKCLKGMKMASEDISQQLPGTFSELLKLSSLVGCHAVRVQQDKEEEQLGNERSRELYGPKQ
ncbi:HAUS augmin-like complex subunit 8 [Pholidichthys leucotaenia]